MALLDTISDKLAEMTPDGLLATGLVAAFCFLVLWYIMSLGRLRVSIWHVAFCGVAGWLLGSALQEYTKLIDWIQLGMTFENFGASMFLVGFCSVVVVLIWNLVATSGRTLVR